MGVALALGACSGEPGSMGTGGSANSGSGGSGGSGQTPLALDLSFCDDVVALKSGSLCAIQPSKTDPLITDSNGTGSGLGYHLVGVPPDLNEVRGLWVHFVGSYGRPYDPKNGLVNSKAWFDEAMARDYLLVVVAYENSKSINSEICTCSNGAMGCLADNCAGDVRHEVLDGIDHSSLISVSADDGVENRLKRLAGYLESNGLTLPPGLDASSIDWSQIMVSGHSQGAGHAYYLAKNKGVRGACYFSGPFDNADMVDFTAPIADWFVTPTSLSDPSKAGAIVASSDPFVSTFLAAWNNYMGLEENKQWFEYPVDAATKLTSYDGDPLDPQDPNDVHGSSVGALELAPLRAQACFVSAAHLQ